MKLSLSIFADWLKDFRPRADLKSDQLEIDTVRLFSREMEWKDNTLYVGRLRDLFKTDEEKVICTHKNDILLLDTDDVETVLNCVLNALEFYSAWNNDMLEMLTTGAMLQDLTDRSEDIVKYPVFLLDAGQRLLAHSRHHVPEEADILWNELTESGSANLGFLMEINQKYPERFQRQDLYIMDQEIFPHPAWHKNFFFQGNWAGNVTLIDVKNAATKGELAVFSIFCSYLDRWFQSHLQKEDTLRTNHLLQTVVTDKNADTGELKRALLLSGWAESDRLMFIHLAAPYAPFNINTHLCRTLNHNFSSLCAVPVELSVCVLCDLSKKSWPALRDELLPWLSASKYYGVVSPEFTFADSFYSNYQYAVLTDRYCGREPGNFYHSSRYIMKYIFQEIQDAGTLDIRHPAFIRLREYDDAHGTELCRTLRVWLQNERNHTETAKALSLHRNSLAYRLKRLRQILSADLDDPMTRLHLLISCELEQG